jgi:hypothetical protein
MAHFAPPLRPPLPRVQVGNCSVSPFADSREASPAYFYLSASIDQCVVLVEKKSR